LEELLEVCKKIDHQDWNRAKNLLKSNVFGVMENRSIRAEDLARQIITYGKHYNLSYLKDRIDSVKISDAQRVLKKMLSTKPSVMAYGQGVDEIPDSTQVQETIVKYL